MAIVSSSVSEIARFEERLAHLKEPFQPPHLKYAHSYQDTQLKDTPPLDPRVRALRSVSVRPLPEHNVCLLVLDLRQQLRERFHCRDLVS